MKRLLVIVAAATSIAACASSAVASNTTAPSASPSAGASQAKAQAPDPCSLVTANEASAAAGKTLVNDVSIGAARITGGCFYGARGTSTGVYVYMQVFPNAAIANGVTVKQFQTVMSGQLGNATGDARELGGFGDRAYEFTAKGNAGTGIAIVVFKGNVVFLVALEPSSSSSPVQGLARMAASRVR